MHSLDSTYHYFSKCLITKKWLAQKCHTSIICENHHRTGSPLGLNSKTFSNFPIFVQFRTSCFLLGRVLERICKRNKAKDYQLIEMKNFYSGRRWKMITIPLEDSSFFFSSPNSQNGWKLYSIQNHNLINKTQKTLKFSLTWALKRKHLLRQ